jgi:hypothetical protein
MFAFIWQRFSTEGYLFFCSSEIWDNDIRDIVFFAKIREIGIQDNDIRNIGILRKYPSQDNGIQVIGFGKRYIREIEIREIVRQDK